MSNGEKTPEQLPAASKHSLLEYLEEFLPFRLPRLSLPQAAQNLDKAAGRLISARGEAAARQIERGSALKDAEAAAQADLIKRGSKAIAKKIGDGDPDLIVRAVQAALGEQTLKQLNRERVVEAAARELEAAPPQQDAAAEIDDDWLNLFASFAEKKTRDDVQSLWGKVLAGEIRQPGSFKLRTLQALSVVDASEAHLIHECFAFALGNDKIFHGDNYEFVPFERLLELENLGVVQAAAGVLTVEVTLTPSRSAHFFIGRDHVVTVESDREEEMHVPDVIPLTSFGRDLYRLGGAAAPVTAIASSLARKLKTDWRIVSLLRLGEQLAEARHKRKVLERTAL